MLDDVLWATGSVYFCAVAPGDRLVLHGQLEFKFLETDVLKDDSVSCKLG